MQCILLCVPVVECGPCYYYTFFSSDTDVDHKLIDSRKVRQQVETSFLSGHRAYMMVTSAQIASAVTMMN
jgi:hypothetical protein